MHGWQVTFFTQQDVRQDGTPLGEWLLAEARLAGAAGATLTAAAEGFGTDHKRHAAHFFERADQPVEVVVILGTIPAERLFARLADAGVAVFYVKAPIEFGMTGGD